MITLTVTKINGATQGSLSRGFQSSQITNLRPTTEGNLATAAIFDIEVDGNLVTYTVSETYATVLANANADAAAAGVGVFRPIWYGTAAGTDTYTATLTAVVPTAYYAGMTVNLMFGITNTGAATINLNGLGAKAIRKGTGGATALSASDLVITKIYTLIYDGTNFQINL